jgi:hypothetical protein
MNSIQAKEMNAERNGNRIIVKGGEKRMASEWEELEKLSKEELIIELVHWRNMYGILRTEQDDTCVWPEAAPMERQVGDLIRPGQVTTEKWAEAIVRYAASHAKGEFDPVFLMDYGMDEDQGVETAERLHREDRLPLPEGTVYCGGDNE